MMVRKIVSFTNKLDTYLLKETLRTSGVVIVKELPMVNAYLCEFPEESRGLLAVSDLEDKFKVHDDLHFKLCCLGLISFLLSPPISPPAPAKQPLQPGTGQGPIDSRRIDWGLKRIGAPQAWEKLKNRRVRVGIIDTGIDYNHPDLKANFKEGISTLDDNSDFLDDYGHGTHVAGIIAAGNRQGMVGINPYVDIYAVKAFDKTGSGKLSDIIEGMDWLMRRHVDVINMSFSTNESNDVFGRVIDAAAAQGIVMVAAAGNDGKEVNYPARFEQVLAVSAIDEKDALADFSSRGPEIDFTAPGVQINSTWIQGRYATKSGTSFSAPHVSGTVADLLNYYGPVPPSQVKGIMAKGAVALDGLAGEDQGAGLVVIPQILR